MKFVTDVLNNTFRHDIIATSKGMIGMIIKSVHKAFEILKLLSDSYPNGIRLENICSMTGINKSTCSHLLDTLIDSGMAERMSFATYRLAAGCFYLTRAGRFDETRLAVCRPVLRWLHKKTGQTVIIAEIQNSTKYVVDYVEGPMNLAKMNEDIYIDNIYRTATGRMILSHMNNEDIYEVVRKIGLPNKTEWQNVLSLEELLKELSKIKKQQSYFAYSQHHGVCSIGISAPIFESKKIAGAVGIAFNSDDVPNETDKEFADYKKYIVAAAAEMTRRIEFSE